MHPLFTADQSTAKSKTRLVYQGGPRKRLVRACEPSEIPLWIGSLSGCYTHWTGWAQQNTYTKHHQTVLPRGWENGIYAMCSCLPQEGHRDFLPQFCEGWWLHLEWSFLAGRLNVKILVISRKEQTSTWLAKLLANVSCYEIRWNNPKVRHGTWSFLCVFFFF